MVFRLYLLGICFWKFWKFLEGTYYVLGRYLEVFGGTDEVLLLDYFVSLLWKTLNFTWNFANIQQKFHPKFSFAPPPHPHRKKYEVTVRMHVRTHTYARAYACVRTRVLVRTHVYTYVHTHVRRHVRTHVRTYVKI